MNTQVIPADREYSLNSMWGACLATKSENIELSHIVYANNVVQTLDTYPFGASRISVSTSTNEQRQWIGQFADPASGLDYLNARYYDSSRGEFATQDPVFQQTGDPNLIRQSIQQNQQTYLRDPQQLNAYAYSRDNPIVYKDPSGNAFGVDDAAGFVVGGLIGASTQLVSSYLLTGAPPTRGQLTGSFLTGGIIGWGAVNTPETLGVSNVVSAGITTGLIGGFYGDAAGQAIDITSGEQTSPFDLTQSLQASGITAATGGLTEQFIPNARIRGLSSGKNNMYSIGKGILTKSTNGSISNINVSTGIKAAVGSQAAGLYRTLIGALTGLIQALTTQKSR